MVAFLTSQEKAYMFVEPWGERFLHGPTPPKPTRACVRVWKAGELDIGSEAQCGVGMFVTFWHAHW